MNVEDSFELVTQSLKELRDKEIKKRRENTIYFELNDWMPEEDYPPEEPYISWCCIGKTEDGKYTQPKLRDKDWVKENELIVVETLLDMSMNFCITASKELVEENCPNLLTTWSKFIRVPEEGCDVPCGRWDAPFLPYINKYIGYHYAEEDQDEYGVYHIDDGEIWEK